MLVLAGLDPSGGAGLLADAEAIREMGARPLCVPTALTVQTRARARGFAPVSPDFLLEAARALLEEEDVRAIKIGMLASPEIAQAIASLLGDERASPLPLVLDPVLAASSGAPLFQGSATSSEPALAQACAAVRSLWGRAWLTPNAPEAQLLLGLPAAPASEAGLEAAGRALVSAGARGVLIKGGHLAGTDAVDLLIESPAVAADERVRGEHPDPREVLVSRLAAPRLFERRAGRCAQLEARGTGCRLASAFAAGLAIGGSPLAAAQEAKLLVARYLET